MGPTSGFLLSPQPFTNVIMKINIPVPTEYISVYNRDR